MFRFHAVVITYDSSLRQSLRRLSAAIGSSVSFVDDPSFLRPDRAFDLIICDTRALSAQDALLPSAPRAPILYLIEGASVVGRLSLLAAPRAAALLCYDGQLDDDEVIVAATKLLRGEVFGSQKYLPWGVTTYSVEVKSYAEKERALGLLVDFAVNAGCRGPLRDRIQRASDELMMNALYHAPIDAQGRRLSEGKAPRDLINVPPPRPVLLQYACSGRYFAVTVQDSYGSLSREQLLSYLGRAESALSMDDKPQGAGLGLVSVLAAASKLVFNLDPGGGTEVIALFDRRTGGQGQFHTRALGIYAQGGQAADMGEDGVSSASGAFDDEEPAGAASPAGPSRPGPGWGLAAALAAALFAVGVTTGYVASQRGGAAHQKK
jgi:hypothetical protein